MRRIGGIVGWQMLAFVGLLASGGDAVAKARHGAAPVQLTVADVGKTVPAAVGQPIVVTLAAATDGGYRWFLFRATGIAQIGDVVTSNSAGSSPIVGAPASQTIRFRATSPGKRIVDLFEQRPWEMGTPPLKTFSFTLDAR